jgi:3-oxoisoapionate kinase
MASGSLLLAYYGDDFTGSTDVMEALASAGLRTVLFMEPPSATLLAQFKNLRAFGVAGGTRAMPPPEMEITLQPVFERLKQSGAPLIHYKICSTFDSSPEIGSIGQAIETGQKVFASPFVPLLAGAPVLGRYTVFGNLFARSGLDSEPFRLDRHPTMRRHPITPMDESDLRLHLSKQTNRPLGLFDLLALASPRPEEQLHKLRAEGAEIILFDVLYPGHLPLIGRLIWSARPVEAPLFLVGSSGIEYALTAYWKESGEIPSEPAPPARAGPVRQVLAISGSCSPVTARQIAWALEHGFTELPLNSARLMDPARAANEIRRATDESLKRINQGENLILHTSRGPNDARLDETIQQLRAQGLSDLEIRLKSGPILGPLLGKILAGILEKITLPRVLVAGGDTSAFVAQTLGFQALEMAAPIAPGSPLCRIFAPGTQSHGMEIIFKGGQVGTTELFGAVLNGTTSHSP